ncbi:MAG: UDP-N-acetylmuramate:L-alanyl-gamma-D-glutamyl-meso-diaminopimelate ligase [Calditrichaeota bacterium]|nr:UDP-N-acetylmuramate:L-alanyl-gamma-D-glutamyl-meso-diaminopimelate ligase [Calditrichota bacterium]
MIKDSVRSIHFIGICGTAMANVAVQLKKMGYRVTGSDENVYPPMSTFLQKNDISPAEGYRESNLDPAPDLVVIGNAISRGNPEAEAVLEKKYFYLSLPDVIREFFIRGKDSIVVSGTHGKTTTTSLLSWVLEVAQLKPSFLIGGIPRNFGKGMKIEDGPYFVIEGDEYDTAFFDKRSKFLHYLPEITIINNIEFDHADIFRSIEDIKLTFSRLINLIPRNGLLVINGDDPIVRELAQKSFAPVESFGFRSDVDWRIENLRPSREGISFSISRNDQAVSEFYLPLTGHHSALNAAGVIIVAKHLNISNDTIQDAFNSFQGVKRRLEVKGILQDITIYDDFAHHPTAIRETLEGLVARFPEQRVWALFEPRTNTTRRNIFQKDFPLAFEKAHGVAIGKINRPHLLKDDEKLDREQIVAELKKMGKPAMYSDSVEEIIDWLLERVHPGDQILVMSNGSFDGIYDKLIKALEEREFTNEKGAL